MVVGRSADAIQPVNLQSEASPNAMCSNHIKPTNPSVVQCQVSLSIPMHKILFINALDYNNSPTRSLNPKKNPSSSLDNSTPSNFVPDYLKTLNNRLSVAVPTSLHPFP